LSWTNTILPKIWSPFYVFNAQYFRNSGSNHFLYFVFAIFNNESYNKLGADLLSNLNDVIYFRGE